jgi:hypothetical protein
MRMKAVFKLEVLFFCFRFSQSYGSAKLWCRSGSYSKTRHQRHCHMHMQFKCA